MAWHHEGKQFICSHSDGTLTIWNVRSPAKPVQTITPHGKDASMLKTTQRQIMLLIVRDSTVNVYVTMSLKHQGLNCRWFCPCENMCECWRSPRVCGSQGLSKHIASSCSVCYIKRMWGRSASAVLTVSRQRSPHWTYCCTVRQGTFELWSFSKLESKQHKYSALFSCSTCEEVE